MRKRIKRDLIGRVSDGKWEWSTKEMKREFDNRRKPIVVRVFGKEKIIKRSEVSEYKSRGFNPYIKDFK